MRIQSALYRALRTWNDGRAVYRSATKGSSLPVVRRVGRRAYGKLSGRLARRLFR